MIHSHVHVMRVKKVIIMKETKIKELESINFHSIAFTPIDLTPFDAYMMTVSGTHVEIENSKKVRKH